MEEITKKRIAEVLPPNVSCGHPGCLDHKSHPCEQCGRTGGYNKVYLMIDIETTGLEDHHEVIEFAAIVFDPEFNELATFHRLVNAYNPKETFSKKAFEVNGFDMDAVNDHGFDPLDVAFGFLDWAVMELGPYFEFVPCGHNVRDFDLPKLEKFIFIKDKICIFERFKTRDLIDTKIMVNAINFKDRARNLPISWPSTSLQNVAKVLGIDPGKAHSALDDCRTCMQVLKWMCFN